jgi:transcriptional regulator with XRE-family HTH domain
MVVRKNHVQPLSGPEKAFGLALRSMRKKKNVSQEEISLEADCDRTTVSLIERGLVSPKLSTIVKMCHVLKIKPSEVMKQMEKSPHFRA